VNYKVSLSYAGEDRRFVEHVAGILERFLGKQSVFHYTAGNRSTNINAFFKFINECLTGDPPNHAKDVVRTVCFVREVEGETRVVVGQQTELLDRPETRGSAEANAGLRTWQGVTNCRQAGNLNLKTVSVALPSHGMTTRQLEQWSVPFDLPFFGQATSRCDLVTDIDRASAEHVAEFVLRDVLGLSPQTHSCKAFTYEKHAISFYEKLLRLLRHEPFVQIAQETRAQYEAAFNTGVPLVWPTVRLRTDVKLRPNSLLKEGTIGSPRTGIATLLPGQGQQGEAERLVLSAALSEHHDFAELEDHPDACMIRSGLCFPEAGPRAQVMEKHPKVGIVVSGGIAPGINAVIDGIVRRHENYDTDGKIYGFMYGLRALSQVSHKMSDDRIELSSSQASSTGVNTAEHVSRGGSVLGTFRLDRLDDPKKKRLLENVMRNVEGLDILYVVGGDGSMKAASLLAREVRQRKLPLSVVGIPKTMDNDILWVWQSFGFATAVEKAREIINCLWTEVRSNPRICVLQLFGSVSGFVVSHAVLSSQSGQCDAALIPEAGFRIKDLAQKLQRKFMDDQGQIYSTKLPFGMIVMAETAIPEDAETYVPGAGLTDDELKSLRAYRGEDVYLDGQTSDDLRSASLKLVVSGIRKELRKRFDDVRIFTNEPRHILRATNPSFSDIIIGQRLGALAVDNAMAGYSNFMVSQWLTEFVLVPLRLVALGRKRIPESGIFWKSVLAKTGQGELAPKKDRGGNGACREGGAPATVGKGQDGIQRSGRRRRR
jgi:6-phosphofructokinase 1